MPMTHTAGLRNVLSVLGCSSTGFPWIAGDSAPIFEGSLMVSKNMTIHINSEMGRILKGPCQP